MEVLIGIVALAIGISIGVVIGIFIGTNRIRKAVENSSVGRLRIDHSEPDEPTRMFTELKGVTPDMIGKLKFAIFEVVDESYISHE